MSWCKKLRQSLHNDMKWKAYIPFCSSYATEINSILNISRNVTDNVNSTLNSSTTESSIHTNNYVNIIDLLDTSNSSLNVLLGNISKMNNYPKNAIFWFEGYNSLDHKDSLCADIKQSAFKNGTVLKIKKSWNNSSKNNTYTCMLCCEHYGQYEGTKLSSDLFIDNQLQMCGTIKQAAHSASSIKNRSRNSCYVRVDDSSNTSNKSKLNRSSTKRCGCMFNITIFFDDISKRWYLKNKRGFKDSMFHNNHIFIDPQHLCLHKSQIPSNIKETITSLVQIDGNINTVIEHIKQRYQINVDYNTIYNIRQNVIDGLMLNCTETPYGSSVDKLISLFKSMNNVSFVYVIHRYDSGFVTYRRNKSSNTMNNSYENSSIDNHTFCHTSIKNWRDELKLSESNKGLVSFAWCHDEELKSIQMYPEFLGADVTFGVNRQRRELFLVAGIDGRNKVFTAFRCFIPSKQQQAYSWVVQQAMPHLLSNELLKFNRCISTDNEHPLTKAVHSAIISSKDCFKNTTFRLDCYHFYTKVWYEKVIPSADDEVISKNIIKNLNNWIMSWFKKIETKQELDISMKLFKKYLNKVNSTIGHTCAEHIVKVVDNIINSEENLLHPYFKNVCTFDFIGDSIVESANFPLKNGNKGVSSKMDISTSALTQLQAADDKVSKEMIRSAKKINSKNIWTKSLTSEVLTDYAEGLAYSTFDSRTYYTKKYVGDHKWLVCSNHLFADNYSEQLKNNANSPTKFMRIREVTIDNNLFMNCSCGYHNRWMMPCRHMACVLDDPKYYVAELFHIRWWKHYHFLMKSNKKDIVDVTNKTNQNILDTINFVRNNHFNKSDGSYIGIPIKNTPFAEYLLSNDFNRESTISNNDDTLITMKAIVYMQHNNESLINGSMKYKKYIYNNSLNLTRFNDTVNSESYQVHDSIEDSVFDVDCNDSDPEDMGAGSQVLSQLSDY